MTWLLLAGLVQAAELDVGTTLPAEEFGTSKDGGSSSGSSGSGSGTKDGGGSGSGNGTSFKKGKLWGWTYRPYVAPGGGLAIANGGTAITGGADVGIKYWKKNWKGDLTAGGSYTTGSVLNGYDVHVGNEFGRREKWWGLTAGLIGFYNGYVAEDTTAATTLEPSLGLDVPVEVTLGPRKYYVYGGVTPSFLFNKDRHVPGLPFGDELEWGVGAGLKLKWINAEVGFTSRITTVGTINTPTVSLSIAGLD